MAKMIPSRIPQDTKSSAEKKLFYKLQDMEDTDNWTVLHSVGIAKHPTQSQGEADFVVVIPDNGVFVLEVKGGRISFHDGVWTSVDRDMNSHIIKDPITEANNGMHAFVDYIKDKTTAMDPLASTLFGFGVVFPDSEVRGKLAIPDLDDAQIADINGLFDMKSYLLGLAKFWNTRKAHFIKTPDVADCKKIVQLLRPDFDSHVSVANQIRSVEKQILTLTDNQQDIFDGIRDNERCLIRGSAGTGKTLIAIDLVRELAEKGNRVAFFCYNRQLAEYLNNNTMDDGLGYCGSMTDYMVNVVRKYNSDFMEPDQLSDKDKFYKDDLPAMFNECFIENELEQFDYLVMDEAQDLMTEQYLDVIDTILVGGIREGNWYFFMDADRQNIFHAGMTYEDIKQLLKDWKVFYARFELRDNCRNSISIIKEIDHIFGSNTRCPMVDEKGAPVVIRTYKKDVDQAKKIVDVVNGLISDGVKPEQITILSPYRLQNSAVARVSSEIHVTDKHLPGNIFFSTIDSFKGLENSVIIITDISDFHMKKNISRLYIGMTRAISALYIILSEKAYHNLGKCKENEREEK